MATRQQPPAAFERGANPLTAEQAGEIAARLGDRFGHEDPEEMAAVLLLVYAFTYERSMTAREGMHQAVEAELGRFTPGYADAVRESMARVLAGLGEGGRR
jgi:hypothetical protein